MRFAYIKASEATSSSYPTTDAHWKGANAAGLVTGLYHFARPKFSPEANADAFASQVNRLGAADGGHLAPCLDLEVGDGHLGGWARRFVARLRERTGARKVMVYSGVSFLRSQLGEGWMDEDVRIWIAHYGRAPGQPGYTSPRVVLHQHTDTGRVAGIGGNVDLNTTMPGVGLDALLNQALLNQEDDLSWNDNFEVLKNTPGHADGEKMAASTFVRDTHATSKWIMTAVAELKGALLTPQRSRVPGSDVHLTVPDAILNADAYTYQLLGQVAGLTEAVKQLAASQGIDGDQVVNAVNAAVEKAVQAKAAAAEEAS